MHTWLKFPRHYGPVPRNDNMYDETIQRSARRQGIVPIEFEHPSHIRRLNCFNKSTADPVSGILNGTACDGKTHLYRQRWRQPREILDGCVFDHTSLESRLGQMER